MKRKFRYKKPDGKIVPLTNDLLGAILTHLADLDNGRVIRIETKKNSSKKHNTWMDDLKK